jgi:ketosteroid isomerase-like protein
MNEQSNTALVEKMYAAFGRGDLQTILGSLTPDVEWTLEGPSVIPYAGKRIGPAQVQKFFEATGKRIDCAVAHVFTIRDGKIAKFLDFVDTAQMADAYVSAAAASR